METGKVVSFDAGRQERDAERMSGDKFLRVMANALSWMEFELAELPEDARQTIARNGAKRQELGAVILKTRSFLGKLESLKKSL